MNNDLFLRYIEEARDCEQQRLDMAVDKGLRRAKNDKFDAKKLLMLAAACVFSFTMFVTVNLRQFETAAEEYYRTRHEIMPGSSEALYGYFGELAGNVKKYLGGE